MKKTDRLHQLKNNSLNPLTQTLTKMATVNTHALLRLERTQTSLSKKIDRLLDEFPNGNTKLSIQINGVMPGQIMILYNAIMHGIVSMMTEVEKGGYIGNSIANSSQELVDIIESFKITEGERMSEVTKKDELVLFDYVYRVIPKTLTPEEVERLPWVSLKPVSNALKMDYQKIINSIMEFNDNERLIVEFKPVYISKDVEISTENPNKKG